MFVLLTSSELEVVHHLNLLLDISTLFIEPGILFITTQYNLVASSLLADMRKLINDLLAKVLAPLTVMHDNILDIPNHTAFPYEFAFGQYCARGNYTSTCHLFNHNDVVLVCSPL